MRWEGLDYLCSPREVRKMTRLERGGRDGWSVGGRWKENVGGRGSFKTLSRGAKSGMSMTVGGGNV